MLILLDFSPILVGALCNFIRDGTRRGLSEQANKRKRDPQIGSRVIYRPKKNQFLYYGAHSGILYNKFQGLNEHF